jgi:hypothetical protein
LGYGRYGLGYGYPDAQVEPQYPEPQYPEPEYPVGYGGSSYEPTGYGVVYNVPPTPPMWRRAPPRIIYVGEGVRHRHHHHHFCARRHGIAMVRGRHISME